MTVLAVLVALLAATAVARFRFRGRRAYLLMILIVQMVPLEALVIPMYLMLRDADLLNLLRCWSSPTWRSCCRSRCGRCAASSRRARWSWRRRRWSTAASRWGAFWRITFPLMAPGLVATAVFAFIQAWNEFILALTLMEQGNQTLPVWLGTFNDRRRASTGAALMAGSTLIADPGRGVRSCSSSARMAAGLATAGA